MKTITTNLETNAPWGSMYQFSSLRATLELTASKESKLKPKSNNKVKFNNILFKHTDNFQVNMETIQKNDDKHQFFEGSMTFPRTSSVLSWKLPPLQTNIAVGCSPCGPMCQFTSCKATSELSTFKEYKIKLKLNNNILFQKLRVDFLSRHWEQAENNKDNQIGRASCRERV